MLVPVASDCEETETIILVDILSVAKANVVIASVDCRNISHGKRILEVLLESYFYACTGKV